MLTLEGIAPDTLIVLAVPYRGTPRGTSVTVRISVDYWTEKRASLKRALRKATPLVLALPLSVNVQDIFRDSWYASFPTPPRPLRCRELTTHFPPQPDLPL